MTGTVHELKTVPPYFEAVVQGSKPFEVRRNDRAFQIGDTLRLREWKPDGSERDDDGFPLMGGYTGRETTRAITYVLTGDDALKLGVQDGYAILGLSALAILDKPLNPWRPTQDLIRLAVLGKFLEEAGEAVSAVSRALIQGIDESEPVTGKPNREWVEDELADLASVAAMVGLHFGLNGSRMTERMKAKEARLSRWHAMLRDMLAADTPPCIACAEAINPGDPYYSDASGGFLHAGCCGTDREGYHSADEEPLKAGQAIPAPSIWTTDAQDRAMAAHLRAIRTEPTS